MLLVAVCFALNAAFLPYAGLHRDARLYSAQVVEFATGRLADDLFFRYGSQSKYSLFPELLAVPTRWVGVEPVFCVSYLLANALRLWATQRLAVRLFGATPATACALVVMAVAPGWWGLTEAFALNEWYLSARVPALALAILGLERVFAGRVAQAGGLLLTAGLVHPLVTAPAVAVAGGFLAARWATSRVRRVVLAAVSITGIVAAAVYLTRTAGTLDPAWREMVLLISPSVAPQRWFTADFLRLGLGAVTVAVLMKQATVATVRLALGLLLAVAVGGLIAGAVAAAGSWALPFQLQFARFVWVLELVRVPVGLTLAARLWSGASGNRSAAVALFVVTVGSTELFHPTPALLFLVAGGLGLLVVGRPSKPDDQDASWRGLATGLAVATAVWYLAVVPSEAWTTATDGRLRWLPFGERVDVLFGDFGPLPRLALAVGAVGLFGAILHGTRVRAAAAGSLGLAICTAAYSLPRSDWVRERFDARQPDARLVRGYLADQWSDTRTPTVYWPGATVERVWVGLNANSYYALDQLAGNIFSRPAAVEGWRRAKLVYPFEVDRIRLELDQDNDPTQPPPTSEQFRALASDPAVDVLVLPHDFGGWGATDGRVFVYDCRQLRGPPAAGGGDTK